MKTNQLQKNIPKGWQIKSFNDCFDVASKLQGLKKSDYKEQGKYPIIDQSQSFITGYTDDNSLLQNIIPTIIFGDHTRILKYIDFPYVLGNDGTKILWAKNENDPKFLFYSLLQLEIPNTGYNRHFKYLEQVIINAPLKPEQEKISEILSKVDEDIEKTEKVINETEKLKNGLMQELFTKGIEHKKFKETKLGDIPEKWEIEELEKVIIDFIGGGTPSRAVSKYWGGVIPWLTVKDFPDSLYVSGSTEYTNEEGVKNSSSNIIPKNSIIIATRVGLGNTFINTVDIAINQDLRGLLVNKNKVIVEFIARYLNFIGKKIVRDGSGSTVKGITLPKLKSYLIPIPEITEQQEITEILSKIDKKILINKKLKEKLIQLKKGLMSDLLSGRVRVNI